MPALHALVLLEQIATRRITPHRVQAACPDSLCFVSCESNMRRVDVFCAQDVVEGQHKFRLRGCSNGETRWASVAAVRAFAM